MKHSPCKQSDGTFSLVGKGGGTHLLVGHWGGTLSLVGTGRWNNSLWWEQGWWNTLLGWFRSAKSNEIRVVGAWEHSTDNVFPWHNLPFFAFPLLPNVSKHYSFSFLARTCISQPERRFYRSLRHRRATDIPNSKATYKAYPGTEETAKPTTRHCSRWEQSGSEPLASSFHTGGFRVCCRI